MNTSAAIMSYTNVGVETAVGSADSHKLMLFQGALLAVASAKNQMLRKETAKKGKSISHAISIVESGLQASLDKSVGGELTQNLSSLYEYICMRLVIANLNDDATVLDEVTRLLTELKGAWELIRKPSEVNAMQHQPAIAANTKPQLTYGKV
jgi:flagellar protein FliS